MNGGARQTPRNAVILGAAKGIIEFLEEMLQALRARRKQRRERTELDRTQGIS